MTQYVSSPLANHCFTAPPSPSLIDITGSESPTHSVSTRSIPTRAAAALASINEEELAALMTPGARYSESTIKKDKWVLRLYELFIETVDKPPWPLEPTTAAAFIRFLGAYAMYAIGSIEDVIIPGLKRMHTAKTLSPPSDETYQCMSQALKDVKNSKSHHSQGSHRDAAILSDVVRIIESTPPGLPTKALEASLWLLSVQTGARAITCSNIRVSDIYRVIYSPSSDLLLVQIRLRVNKGNPNWDQIITLEGDPSVLSSDDAVYWLNEHLKKQFTLDLNDFTTWKDNGSATEDALLWDMSTDAMNRRFKDRAFLAGYPDCLLTFHSLRSGFICTALLNAGSNENAVQAVLEKTAFIAGWVPRGPAQMRYVKASSRQTIVTSRMIRPGSEGPIMEPLLAQPDTFHNMPLSASRWNDDVNYKSFFRKVDAAFTLLDTSHGHDRESFRNKCWNKSFTAYVLAKPELEDKAKGIYRANPMWNNSIHKWNVESQARKKVGRQDIARRLHADYTQLDSIADDFISLVSNEMQRTVMRREVRRRESLPKTSNRDLIPRTGHRKRVKWTQEEEDTLIRLREEGKTWVQVAAQLPNRTNVDCKDKMVNLLKKPL